MAKINTQIYSKHGLWSLFLMCAFPLHAWTLILAFRDLSWVTERTNAWDAVGVMAYGLLFALIESTVIFLVATGLGFLVSAQWDKDRRVVLLAVLVLIASMWAIAGQLFFLLNVPLPGQLIQFLVHSGHPLRVLYVLVLTVVTPTVLIPALLVLRSRVFFQFFQGVIDRVSVLTMFYLFFDIVGLVIVLVRNL